MSFSFGRNIVISLSGESHSNFVEGRIEGLPSGLPISEKVIEKWLLRRRPGISEFTSQRKEEDAFTIKGGVMDGHTNGGPVVISIENKDVISSTYEKTQFTPRPGHSDYPSWIRYGKYRDYRGGGFFSGRMTTPLVAVGSIATDLLQKLGIELTSYIARMGEIEFQTQEWFDEAEVYRFKTRIPDDKKNAEAENILRHLMKNGDSVGAEIATRIKGMPAGVGEPFFDSVESMLSHLIFSIPAVKGIEFGSGFKFPGMLGSQSTDEYSFQNQRVEVQNNHNGGILGGLTTGMEIAFNVAIKPTSSIRIEQDTVNLKTLKAEKITVMGRHDPCIGIRAVPVVQSCASIVMLDLLLEYHSRDILGKLRENEEN